MDQNERYDDVTGSMLGMLWALPAGWWLLAFLITSGTNLLDFFAAAQPNAARTTLFAVAAATRIILVFWLGYALIRKLGGVKSPMLPTLAFGRYALFMIGIIAVMAGAGALAAKITGQDVRQVSTGIVTFFLMTLFILLIIRLYAWQAALAAGDRSLGPVRAWRALSGVTGRLVAAYLIVAIVAAVHSVLTRIALASADEPAMLVILALIDGLVSSVQIVLTCGLAVIAWRLARSRAGALRDTRAVA